jgi:biopolymer transport protein ExbD
VNLRPGHRSAESVDINLTPLIDVVFLLLIFFMVSTSFDRHAKLKVQLPSAEEKMHHQTKDPVVLSIDAKGKYYINDRQVVNTQFDTLKAALQKTVDNNPDITLLLRADGRTPHQSVVRAMDVASQLGITKLSIATVESK